MEVCFNTKVVAQDPRFQELRAKYEKYPESMVMRVLQHFREKYDYEADWYPSTPGQKGAFSRFMKYELKGMDLARTTRDLEQHNVDLMYETMYRTFTPAQLESRLSMLQAVFSYIVETEAQKQGVLLKSNEDRQQVIKSFGKDGKNPYVSIMQKVFEFIENFYAKDRDFHKRMLIRNYDITDEELSDPDNVDFLEETIDGIISSYKKVLELKDQLAALAAPRIGDTEGFIVSIKDNKVSFTDMHDAEVEGTDEEGKQDDGEDYEEGTKGERYTDFRTLKLMETLSPKAKKFLSKLYKVDFDGHVVYDDINMPQTVGTRQAAVVLHRVLRDSTPQTFLDDIKAAAVNYPWMAGLWRELNKHPQYQTTIYDAFKKCETNYFYINFEDGNMKPSFANSRAAGNVIMREAGNNITGGYVLDPEFSIYTEDRLLKSNQELAEIARKYDAFDNPKINDALRFINMVTDDAGLSDKAKLRWISEIEKKYNEDFHYLLNAPEEAMDIFLAKNPDVLPALARALRGCGVTVDEKDLRTLALQKFTKRSWKFMSDKRLSDSDKYGRNKLYQIIRATNGLLGKAQETVTMSKRYNNLGKTNTGQYFYNTASYQFRLLNNVLSLAKYNETEERVFNNGKSLSTNNDVNLLHQIVDELSNSDRLSNEDYQKMIMDKYAKYEGMSLGDGDTMRLTGWLKEMYDGNHAGVDSTRSARFRLIDVCGYNHLEYSKMNKSQHILAAMAMYFKHREMEGFCGSYVGYEVPIQADYSTAYNFVTGPTFGARMGSMEEVIESKRKQEIEWAGTDDVEAVEKINAKYDKALEDYRKEYMTDPDNNRDHYRSDRHLTVRLDGKLYAADIVEKLADETLIELERIQAIRDREKDPSWKLNLGTYDRQGKRFQIFPEFNDNGFEEKYASFDNADEARDFLLEQVAAQLEKVIADDIRTLNESKVLSHPAMKSMKDEYYGDDLYAEDGKFESLPGYAQGRMQDFFLNTFYARQQMCKIFTGGMQQFNGLLDYEKRNMILHATHSSMYTEAKDRLGNKVGKSTENCLYLEDDVAESAIMKPVSEMLGQLLRKGIISRDQYDTMLKSYKKKITTTDGQAFRTLESYRRIMMMTDKWDDRQEAAYKKIINYSEHPSIDLSDAVSVLMDGIKPIYTGFEEVQAYPGQKPVRMTVLHKYSETLLLPYFLAEHCLGSQSAPLRGLSMARRELAKQGKDIDLFIMHSGVKVGAFSVASPFAKDKKTGERLLKDADGIRDYLVEYVNTVPGAVHTLDMKGYGIAASVSHDPMDERIAIASQAEKVGMANIEDGDKVNVNGKEMDAREARELYYQIKSADIIDMYKQLRSLFFSSEALDKAFREEISSRPYSSREMQYALCLLKNGQFAVPLFAPNVEHQVQQLMASMIKKRLTKPKSEGANILQTTGFGVDMDVQGFDDRNAIADSDKLEIKFDGEGENKRIKYVEVFMPLNDSRLKVFADSDGKITPERLQELIDNKTIPEEMLEFVAYRTPSDAEHSVIPCRIKGFTSPADGPSIKMPKEVMVLTGHDYDGDKMRCHFKSFRLVDRSDTETELTDDEVTQMILGQKSVNPEFKKCVLDEYDYSKPAYENTRAARVNERVSLFFAQLTSPAGSRRVLIPGGCDMTKVYAKSIYLVAASRNPSQMEVIRKALSNLGMAEAQIRSVTSDTSSLYDYLSSLSDGELSDIMNAVNGYLTPFSMTHAADSFEYMMGGADMIGIYAMYNSAFQMFQRINLTYTPGRTKLGDVNVTMFGHQFGKLFQTRNRNGMLASLSLARLLNAAVDNGKDPVLGYLHQNPEMSKLTFFMLAAGLEEEDVHLVLNQPIVLELMRRMKEGKKGDDEASMYRTIDDILSELTMNGAKVPEADTNKYWNALKTVASMDKDDYTSALGLDFSSLRSTDDLDLLQHQCAILATLRHLNGPASDLAKFVRYTRPESAKGAIGTDIASIIAKKANLDDFRQDIVRKQDNTIAGMGDILKARDANIDWSDEYLNRMLGDKLPEAVALNTLMIDNSFDMFSSFFPQARRTWYDFIVKVAKEYDYSTIDESLIRKIANDMILWKLLSDKNFVQGDPQEEQKRILVDVPKDFRDLKVRIEKAHENPGTDMEAEQLYENVFLKKIRVTSPEEQKAPRLMFFMDGAPAEGTRDLISSGWNELMQSKDPKIRKLGTDLFKYNMYSNGFSYGMYEFAHFAPYSVLSATPGYIQALRNLVWRSHVSWRDEREMENFINQYYMNHWGEGHLVSQVKAENMPLTKTAEGLKVDSTDKEFNEAVASNRYIVVSSSIPGNRKGARSQTLYRVDKIGDGVYLSQAAKLGAFSRRSQVTRQYNPVVDYHDIQPVTPGNDSSWGTLSSGLKGKFVIDSNANIEAPGMMAADRTAAANARLSSYFGMNITAKDVRNAEDKQAGITKSDSELDKLAKRSCEIVRNITDKMWARYSDNGYEVSSIGDKRFSALYAKFRLGTIIDGVDVGGMTIENVYQSIIKKSGKGQTPSKESKLYRSSVNSYTGNITPDANTIFVFGSNPEGRHGAGAAKIAREKFGAKYGQGEGLQGSAYALPTKDLRVTYNNSLRSISPAQIIESIKNLYETARQHPDKQFKVAYRNTDKASLNGYTGLEMIEMFLKAGSIPANIVFSKEWVDTGKFNLSREELEDFSYVEGYLPLWKKWAEQNPELINDLREKSAGKVLTDKFASTRVSQARALSDILASGTNTAVITGSEAESLVQTMPVEDENVNSAPVEGKVQESSSTAERQFTDAEMLKAAQDAFKKNMFGSIKVVDKDKATGEYVVNDVPATPDNVRKARQQRTFTELNRKLREILNRHGIGIGVLYNAEARMNLGGVAVFDTANVTAEGLLELIRLAEGYEGEQALPEEFAHVALEMLGHDHALVKRLLNAIDDSDEALREAYESEDGNLYDEYVKVYGNENRDKLVLEAAGKLVAKALLREQKIRTGGVRGLITRIVDAIKSMLRKFSRNEVQDAIFEASGIASKIAREMLGGRLADDMSIQNIASNDSMFNIVKTNLTDKQDILSKLWKTETKRYEILKKRAGYYNVGTAPASVEAAERQLKKLEASIRSHKVEDAVMTYLNDGLAFLAATEKSLDDSVNSGRPMNSVCKKLNTVRDTLYSYAKAVDYIREGISSKEIADSLNLTETLDRLQGVLNKFHDKYMSLARRYFEEMLSNVYGESGVTVEIGRERGRQITIHEMATRADRDISLASRWFDAIADCNDYVLKAVDDITRDAKMRARKHAAEIKPRIEVAVADLVRETGSRDQSFMFEKDAKGHRTGKYISEAASQKLPKAQKKFYDTMIEIQKEADRLLPKPLIDKRGALGIVMVRKYAMERVAAAKGFNGKMLEAWEGIRNEVMETSEDFDPEVQEVAVDFEGNKVDMLPVKFLNKGKKESYDDMTDDVAASMMAYAGMAYEYGEMSNVINTLENAKYMAGERDVVQRSGNRQRQETIDSDDVTFTTPFTKKAAQLHAQKALEDFFSMHIYGHMAADEGTFGNTRISKRKVVNMVNSITSFSQMAFNLTQRISNVTTGAMQVVVESAGKGVYNIADVTWASNIYMKNTADRFAQTGRTESDNKLSLWNEHFDVHQDNGRYNNKYKKGDISRWFNTNMLYAGLTAGEDYLSSVTSLAVARNYKVKDASGKVGNLWDAYEVKYLDEANRTGAYLALKKGYTKTNGSPITAEDEARFAKQVAALNFEMQGIYNMDDRSAVQQYAFGALMIMYRKWIAPAIKRRYGRVQYSALKGTYEEGYYITLWNLLSDSFVDAKDAVTADQSDAALLNIFNDISAFANAWKINYSKMTAYEKSCITKACTELGTVAGLWLATTLLLRLPPDDKDGMLGWAESMMLSQMLRLRSELWAQTPMGVVPESFRILKSPFAAADPIKRTLDTFQLILPWNYFTKIKSGRYRGHSKAYQYMMSMPILGMYRQVQKFIDPTPLIQYYTNS